VAAVITFTKFVLGALIIVLAIFDVDPQPFTVILGLLLMGVLTVEQFYDWFPTSGAQRPPPPEGDEGLNASSRDRLIDEPEHDGEDQS
jgi:hypothetical protein